MKVLRTDEHRLSQDENKKRKHADRKALFDSVAETRDALKQSIIDSAHLHEFSPFKLTKAVCSGGLCIYTCGQSHIG